MRARVRVRALPTFGAIGPPSSKPRVARLSWRSSKQSSAKTLKTTTLKPKSPDGTANLIRKGRWPE